MSVPFDAAAFAVAMADIAWTIVLILCGALIVWPFLFLFLAKRGDSEEDVV
jgi:hypothetical protein